MFPAFGKRVESNPATGWKPEATLVLPLTGRPEFHGCCFFSGQSPEGTRQM